MNQGKVAFVEVHCWMISTRGLLLFCLFLNGRTPGIKTFMNDKQVVKLKKYQRVHVMLFFKKKLRTRKKLLDL